MNAEKTSIVKGELVIPKRGGPPVSDLRDLARQLQRVAEDHFCYAQVAEIIRNATDHICAIARIEEMNTTEKET